MLLNLKSSLMNYCMTLLQGFSGNAEFKLLGNAYWLNDTYTEDSSFFDLEAVDLSQHCAPLGQSTRIQN